MPSGFGGEVNLLLLGFVQAHQRDIDTWLAALPGVVTQHLKLSYYELPVISRSNPLGRWFLNTAMRSGIPDKAQRARTITLYLDKPAFRAALQIPSEDRICILLINREGQVLWRSEGPVDDAKRGSLETFLRERGL